VANPAPFAVTTSGVHQWYAAGMGQKQGTALLYIQLGNPKQNAYIERHNRTVRYV